MKKLNDIKKFKKENILILEAWHKLMLEAQEEIFNSTCLKSYLNTCEPFYCTFRITNECKFSEELSKLDKITKFQI